MNRILALLWLLCGPAYALTPAQEAVLLGQQDPSLDCNFLGGLGSSVAGTVQVGPKCPAITFSRAAGSATDGLYTDAAGSTYNSYATNVPRFVNGGLLIEDAATNRLLNSDTPATQTTASLAAGTKTLWVIGTGTATPSAGGTIPTGTATGCTGFSATSAGTPTNFTCTGAGTIVVTVGGTLTRFQLTDFAYPGSYIPTTGTVATRAKELVSMPTAGWLNATQGTLITEASWFGLQPATLPRVVQIDDGTANNAIIHFVAQAAGNIVSNGTSGGVQQWNIAASAAWSAGKVFKMGTAYQTNVIDYALNGTLLTRDTVATIPAGLTTMHIGQDQIGTVSQSMLLRGIRYFPRPMPRTEVGQAVR